MNATSKAPSEQVRNRTSVADSTLAQAEGGEASQGEAAPERSREAVAAAGGPFNLSQTNSCALDLEALQNREIAVGYHLQKSGCKHSVCPCCSRSKARKEVEKLQPRVEQMKNPVCLTFTIAHARYPNQRQIFEWLMQKRYINRTLAILYKAGYLASMDYFRKLEFQMGEHHKPEDGKEATQQCHFHVIVDAKRKFIPHDLLMQAWNRALPEFALDHPDPDYPRMGFAQFRWVDDGGAKYAAKYVSKKEGVPQWFLDYLDEGHNAMMTSTSRGFYPKQIKAKGEGKPRGSYGQRVPVRERLKMCDRDAIVTEEMATWGGQRKYRFKGKAGRWMEAVEKITEGDEDSMKDLENVRRVKISERQMQLLLGRMCKLSPLDFVWEDGTPVQGNESFESQEDAQPRPDGQRKESSDEW